MLSPSESYLRSKIFELLNKSNIQCAVTDAKTVQTTQGKRQLVYPAGWPDITAAIPLTARAWAIEVKTDEGELRESQIDKLAELRAAGWLVTVARSVEDVSQELKQQLAQLDRRALDAYFVALRHLRSAAAHRDYLRKEEQRARERAAQGAPSLFDRLSRDG